MSFPLGTWCPSLGKKGKGKEVGHQGNSCIPTAYMYHRSHIYKSQYTKRCSPVFLVAAMHSAAESGNFRQLSLRQRRFSATQFPTNGLLGNSALAFSLRHCLLVFRTIQRFAVRLDHPAVCRHRCLFRRAAQEDKGRRQARRSKEQAHLVQRHCNPL